MVESTVDCTGCSSYDRAVKRIGLIALFAVLTLVELYLLTGLLPMHWQYAINDALNNAIHHVRQPAYDYSVVTHPALDLEIEQALQEHAALRVCVYTIVGCLFAGNTFAMIWLWRLLKRATSSQAD